MLIRKDKNLWHFYKFSVFREGIHTDPLIEPKGITANECIVWITHLRVWRRKASSSIDSYQGIFTKGHIELEVHGVVDEDLRPPEDPGWYLLRDLTPHVYLAHVYETVIWEQAIRFACDKMQQNASTVILIMYF